MTGRGRPGSSLEDLDLRLSRTQEETRDLGQELLDLQRRFDEILRLMEGGEARPVPVETLLEERLRSLDTRLTRIESLVGRQEENLSRKVTRLLATLSRPARRSAAGLVRRALRRFRLGRPGPLQPADWMFTRSLVRRPALRLPAVAVVVAGEEGAAAARAWLGTQSLEDVSILSPPEAAGGPAGDGARWRFHLPLPAPDVSSTFLEMHLWAAATEGLLFTAAPGEGGPSIVLRRDDLGPGGLPPAAEGDGPAAVVARTLPLPIRSAGASPVASEEPLARQVLAIGDRWIRRDAYLPESSFRSLLTPLDSLLPLPGPVGAAGPAAPLVALVPTLSGAGPAGFARGLGEVLVPRRPVVVVSLDTREGPLRVAAGDGSSRDYPVGILFDRILHLSIVEHLVRRVGRAVLLDFTSPDGDSEVPRLFRLRNPSSPVVDARWRVSGSALPGFPPFALPPGGGLGPPRHDRRASARARLGVPDGSILVMLLDVLDEHSRALDLIDVAARLESQGGWSFRIVGDGPLAPFLRERVAALRLASMSVVPSGARPEDDLAAADVLCAPGPAPGNANVLFQALALGIPTVAAAGAARSLGLEEGVVPVEETGSGASLASALLGLADPVARENLSASAIQAARGLLERSDPVAAWRETVDRISRT